MTKSWHQAFAPDMTVTPSGQLIHLECISPPLPTVINLIKDAPALGK